MKRMDRYIGNTVLASILLAWLVVSVLEALFIFMGELGDVGRGGYTLADAALFVLLTLPGRAYQSFPMAALIGSLLGLGNLMVQSELNTFRLAGCSPARITRSVIQAGLAMLLAVVAMGEGWAPLTQQMARQLRATAIFNDVSVQRDAGFWVRDGRRFIQVARSGADGSLHGLVIYTPGDGSRLLSVGSAAQASYVDGQWQLDDIRTTLFSGQAVRIESEAHRVSAHLVDPRLAQLLTRDAQTLTLPELGSYIEYLKRNGSNVAGYRLRYWQRLATPLAVLAMLLLAVGLVLGPLSRQGIGQRILVGVVAGLVFKLVNETSLHAGLVYGIAPWASALLPSLLVSAGGLWLLRSRR